MSDKALLVDFWGTLFYPKISIEEYHHLRAEKLREVFLKYGITLDHDLIYATYRETRRELDILRKTSQVEIDVKGEIALLLHKLQIPPSPELINDLVEAYLYPYVTTIDLAPGVKEFFTEVRQKGYLIVLASNTMSGYHTIQVLRRYQLYNFFDYLALSDKIGFRKPSLKFFSYIIFTLDVAPEKSFMVGDEEADMSAKKLGFTTVAYEGFHKYEGEIKPNFYASSFYNLADLL